MIKFNEVINKGDIIKFFILLAVATVACYFVYREYTKPFELGDEIKREAIIKEYESQKLEPVIK